MVIFGIKLLKKPIPEEPKKEIKIIDIDKKETAENKFEKEAEKEETKDFLKKANKEEIKKSIYSNSEAERIPPEVVEKIKSDVELLKARGDFEGALNKIINEGKKYNSDSNKSFKENLASQIEDLTLMSNMEYSYKSEDLKGIRSYMGSVENVDNFIMSVLNLPEFIRVFLTDDLESNSIMDYRKKPTVWVLKAQEDDGRVISSITINDEEFKVITRKEQKKMTLIGFYKEGYPKVKDRRAYFEDLRKKMDDDEGSNVRKMTDEAFISEMLKITAEEESREIEETNADFNGEGIVSPRESVYDEFEDNNNTDKED